MKILMRPIMLLACTLMLLASVSAVQASSFDSLYRERMEIGRALIEVQSTNWPTVLPYYTVDIEYHDPIVDIYGIDTMAEFLARLFESSPDLVTTIADETLSGGVYTATWTMVGQFSGVPYSAKGISIIKFRDESTQVFYQRDYYSENDIMINIPGLDEAVIGFRTFYRCAVDPTFQCPLGDGGNYDPSGIELPSDSLEPEAMEGRGRIPVWLYQQQMEIGRALVEINADNWTSLLQYYANNIEYRDPIVEIDGIDIMTEFLGRLFSSAPDLVTTVEDESLVRGVYTATWTMTGQFGGVPFSAKGMSIVKFHGWSTRVYYSRDYYTEGDIMINIPGLDEAVAAFRTYYRCAVDPTFQCPLPGPEDLTGFKEVPTLGSDVSQSALTFALRQNVPNPFSPATEISFVVPKGGANVSLRIYDAGGRLVRTLLNGFESAGTHVVSWSGDDDQGRPVANGMYLYQLTAPSFSEIKKMVLRR